MKLDHTVVETWAEHSQHMENQTVALVAGTILHKLGEKQVTLTPEDFANFVRTRRTHVDGAAGGNLTVKVVSQEQG